MIQCFRNHIDFSWLYSWISHVNIKNSVGKFCINELFDINWYLKIIKNILKKINQIGFKR